MVCYGARCVFVFVLFFMRGTINTECIVMVQGCCFLKGTINALNELLWCKVGVCVCVCVCVVVVLLLVVVKELLQCKIASQKGTINAE